MGMAADLSVGEIIARCRNNRGEWLYIKSSIEKNRAMETLVLPDLRNIPFDQLDGTRILGLTEVETTTYIRENQPVVSESQHTYAGSHLISHIRQGLSTHAFDRLQTFLGCSTHVLASALGIAPRTLARRRGDCLSSEESDRLLRAARLAEFALVVFEDPDAAATWLTTPKRLLRGETPLEHTDTAPGAREVEDMLYAIEFSAAA